ncbi:hypothetical protein H4219_004402 [Mycoemilia scoparia]|uniref:BAG domain-containing protein n=1 Tax=Mycoemilia scoparia TaxID=417184 RepID=A0A9W8DRF8_9FUNG|nr:hypothetical protein H4219_004402 [Mycoemilia scoparia]
MKDDKATLDRYGIYVGAKLKLVGVQENGKKDKEMTPTEQQEHKSIQRIDHIVQKTSDQLLERMQNYVANAQLFKKQFLDSSSETYQAMMQASPDDFMGIRNSEKQNLHKDYVFITETLMQSLLSIDNVPLDDGADLGRNRRKQAVKQLQGWMDQMDKVRQSVEYNDESGNKSEGSDEGEMQNKL